MLFDGGNPYRGGLPAALELGWDDFTCGLSASNEAAIGRRADWTILLYAAADNNLAEAIYDNVAQLKAIGSNAAVHVCALFDGPLLTDSFFARLNADSSLAQDIILRYGELRTNSPDELARAIRLSSFFPAQRRLIILSGHGQGWRGALLDQNLGLRYKRQGLLRLPGDAATCDARLQACQRAVVARLERATPLPAMGPFDIIAVDACYMGSFEALPFLASQATIVVLSEDQAPAEGYPYSSLLAHVRDDPTQSPDTFAAYLVSETKGYYDQPQRRRSVTQIALSAHHYPAISDMFCALIKLLDMEDDTDFALVSSALDHAWQFEPTGSVDLKGFVLKLAGHPRESVRSQVTAFLDTWETFVISSAVQGTQDGTNGLSLYAPKPAAFDVGYIDIMRQSANGLWEWCLLLARYYLRRVGNDAPASPLIALIQAALDRTTQSAAAVPDA